MSEDKPIGILLAAGRGRRMGGNKQFHVVQTPEGEKSLVAAAFDTISSACEKMIVVLGHRAEEVAAALGERKFEIVTANPDVPMFDSIHAGLSRIATRSEFQNPPPRPLPRPTLPEGGCLLPSLPEGEHLIPSLPEGEHLIPSLWEGRPLRAGEGPGEEYVLLQLGDHPSLNANTLNQIFATAAAHPDKAIMPTYQGNGGHPVLIPASIAQQILSSPCPDGLRGFWIDHPELCVRMEVDDPSVTRDIDTI
jgi:CTP:molybdopterin cytidylyltransferase MocA